MKKKITLINTLRLKEAMKLSTADNFSRQLMTMKSVRKLDENIVLLDCKHDYALDELLSEGCASIGDMLDFARRRMFYGVYRPKLAEPEMGCSVFSAYNDENHYIMGRNFDYKDGPCLIVRTSPEKGYRSLGVVDCNFMLYGKKNLPEKYNKALKTLVAPYICVDGINEKGVAIAVLELKTKTVHQKTGKTPITTTVIIRNVLDNAATTKEAIELFRQYDMNDIGGVAYHFVVSDASGESVLIEYLDNEMKLFYPQSYGEDCREFLSVTNHFIDPKGPEVKRGAGYDRQEKIISVLKENKGIISSKAAMTLLSQVQLSYNHPVFRWPVTTLWSAVYNCSEKTMDICAGQNYERVYSFSVCGDEKFD